MNETKKDFYDTFCHISLFSILSDSHSHPPVLCIRVFHWVERKSEKKNYDNKKNTEKLFVLGDAECDEVRICVIK